MMNILVLCHANLCRSVIAQALLARRLAASDIAASVRSAGLLPGGEPAAPGTVRELAARGIDVTAHRSRRVTEGDLTDADLVLTMAREQLRYAVVTVPGAWPRAFTLKELIRRGRQAGPRQPGEPLSDWLARVHRGRDRTGMLGSGAEDDLADPIGGPASAFATTAAELDYLLDRFADLAWGQG
ncbi:MAG TPA: hypothetical protein VNF47_06350 [Streptosporangiaceae bacterium]|nr:hypothetical protein [Streptosporangiaceae bacterium]